MSSTPTEHTDTCETCGGLVRWHEHPADAVNPAGLWHHDPDGEYDHEPAPQAVKARMDAPWPGKTRGA